MTTFAAGSPSAASGFGGSLDAPGTTVLSPGHLGNSWTGGDKLTVGRWLDPSRTWGVEASGFLLGDRVAGFADYSNGARQLRVPFTNVPPGGGFPLGNSSFVLADPGFAAGGQTLSASARLWGLEADAIYRVNLSGPVGLTMLGGLRYLNLSEELSINSTEMLTTKPGYYSAYDNFSTVNQFFGGEVGAEAEMKSGPFDASLTGKVALGENFETLSIIGSTNVFGFGVPAQTESMGLFAEPTNIGNHGHNVFAFVPEARIEAGYQATSALRLFVDYDALYVSDVLRPGNAIDTTLNFTQNPAISGSATASGAARPAPIFKGSSFLAQGVGFGMKFAF